MKEFTTAVEHSAREDEGEPTEEQYVEFKLDGREMKAYYPNENQMLFLAAVTGRGQTTLGRLAGMTNIIFESLRGDDKDYFESRMLTSEKKDLIPPEVVSDIFEHIVGEWFGHPTNESSDSAGSPPSGGR